MATVWVFERAADRVVVTREQFASGHAQLIVVWTDGVARSRAFTSVQEAIAYQQEFESALASAGWVRGDVLGPFACRPVP